MWPFRSKPKSDEIDKRRLEAFSKLAVVSAMCIGPNLLPVMRGKRDAPHNVSDSGWTLSSRQESKEFCDDSSNYKLVPLERMIETDDTLAILRDLSVGSEITRRQVSEPWRFIVEDRVVDDDGKVVGGVRE